MDCTHYAKQVQWLAEDELLPAERQRLENHARGCYRCAELGRETARLFAVLNALPREPLPEGFEEHLLERLVGTQGTG